LAIKTQGFFNALVDEVFHIQNPDLNGRSLTKDERAHDHELYQHWLTIAEELQRGLEYLDPNVQQKLGSYQMAHYDHWLNELKSHNLSEHAFVTLVDTRFKTLFPLYAGPNLDPQHSGQIWFAVVDQLFQDMQSGQSLEIIRAQRSDSNGGNQTSFQAPRSNGTTVCSQNGCKIGRSQILKPAGTMAYVIWLEQGMSVNLDITHDPRTETKIWKHASDTVMRSQFGNLSWKSEIPQTGFYEILVTSNDLIEANHQLVMEIQF
jgi:hypothetical protein